MIKNTYLLAAVLWSCGANAQNTTDQNPSILTSGTVLTPDQTPRLTGIPGVFQRMAEAYPEEKVHLHLDRDRYFAGDTIWFKSYFFFGGLPGTYSKELRIDLYKDTTLVETRLYPVSSSGDLELPKNLPEGTYTIQAYTPWMANFDPVFFYHYTFPLYHPHANADAQPTAGPVTPRFDIQFLPEGGASIESVPSRVAFVAVDDRGQPLADIKGWVADESGDTVAHLNSVHDGMGAFVYIPQKGRIYYAHVWTSIGRKEIPLPAASPDGVVLKAKLVPGGVQVQLRSPDKSRYFNHSLTLLATMYGNPVYEAGARLTEDVHVFNGTISTSKCFNGILRISLIDEDSVPLAERVIFIQPKQLAMQPELKCDKLSAGARALNTWTLHFPDSVRGSLSVSVTDADAVPRSSSQRDIFSDLLLTEDEDPGEQKELRGTIRHPAWYFEVGADSAFRKEALDLVMLTHGWRTLQWKDLREPGFFPKIQFPMEQSIAFSGRVYYGEGKKLVRNKDLNFIIQSPGAGSMVKTIQTDSTGHFRMENLQFFDSVSAYFQVNEEGDKAKIIRLQLDTPKTWSIVPAGMGTSEVTRDTAFEVRAVKKADADSLIHRFASTKELKQIFIRGKSTARALLQEMDGQYTFGLFSNTDGFSFDLVHHPETFTELDLFSFLSDRVPSLRLKGSFPHYILEYRGGGAPALYLNEMATTIDQINAIPFSSIAYVKFIYPPFMGAYMGGPNGAIAVYIRKGDDLFAQSKGLNNVTIRGYDSPRKFYAPLYSDTTAGPPDYRLTLSWQPSVFVNDSTRDATIQFYNNDYSHRFRVVAEGMDVTGRLLHFEREVEVPTTVTAGR